MTNPLLFGTAPPNAVAFVLAWLLPITQSPLALGSKRWTTTPTTPLPYRMVNRITGADDQISDFPVLSVHTFADGETAVQREEDSTHRRMTLLADDPLLDVAMAGGGVANCEWLETLERAVPVDYGASSSVVRLVSRYRLGLHFTPVT